MARKFGLGKGLDALIPEDESNGVLQLSINRIKPNKKQPRRYFDDEKIAALAESLKEHGLLQPIIVKKLGDDYQIIAGERRWRAAKKARLKEVPVIIMDISDAHILEVSLIENIQRQDLNPIEEANAFRRLLDDFHITQEVLSKRIGKSRTAIANTLRLLQLDDRVQQFVIEGVLSEGHGRALLGLPDGEAQFVAAQRVIDNALSVRDTEHLVSTAGKKATPRKQRTLDVYYKDLERRLSENLGTKVSFKPKAKNKGKIEIEYYSSEELERILEFMNLEE